MLCKKYISDYIVSVLEIEKVFVMQKEALNLHFFLYTSLPEVTDTQKSSF